MFTKVLTFYIDVEGGEDEGPEEHKNSIGDGWNPNWFHAQGGTHEETPLPGNLVVDGTARGGAEAGVFSSMRQWEVVASEKGELIDSKSEDPSNVDRKSVV